MIWDPLERFLWGFTIAIMLICSCLYVFKGKQRETFNEKLILYGSAIMIFGQALQLFFIFLAELQIQGRFINETFYGDYNNINSNYVILMKLGNISGMAGILIYFLAFEKIYKHTRYILTLIEFGFIIIVIISPFKIALLFMDVVFMYNIFSLLIILFVYIKYSQIEFKTVSLFILVGSTLIINAWILRGYETKSLNSIPLIIAPILFLLGAIIWVIPTLVNPKYYARNLSIWVIIGSFVITLCIIITLYLWISLSTKYLFGFVSLSIEIYLFYRVITDIKFTKIKESQNNKVDLQDILRTYAKPPKITEEEVFISKEKKICMVCKGNVARNNIYLCPDCNTFYCNKCSSTLADLENMCWVCDTPFDESKPIKPLKKEEEEIAVEEKTQQNGKKK